MMSSFEVMSKSIFAIEPTHSTLALSILKSELSTMSNNSIDLVQNFDWNVSDFDIDAAKALGKNQIDDETSFRVLIALIVVSAAILGLIVNFFILVLSLFRIHGDYRHFVANLAVIDIIGG